MPRPQNSTATAAHVRAALPAILAIAVLSGCAAGPDRTASAAGELPTATSPLPLAECLDPDRARSFALIESDELLVDAGRHRYHLRLAHACPELGISHALEFRPAGGIGRLCGGAMETVLPVGARPPIRPCPVSSLRRISESEYQTLLDGAPTKTIEGG